MPTPPPVIDWDSYLDEAVDLLCRFIRVDTSNPPGGERAACAFLGELLDQEGIEFALYDAGNDRVSLRAVLPGDGSARPFMLLNHTDVVPVEAAFWSEPAFAGAIKDGCVWGPGALDMKSLGILELLAFVLVKRLDLPDRLDLVLFAVADAEAGRGVGAAWVARGPPETLRGRAGCSGWAAGGGCCLGPRGGGGGGGGGGGQAGVMGVDRVGGLDDHETGGGSGGDRRGFGIRDLRLG